MTTVDTPPSNGQAEIPSLDELRAAHVDLLRRQREANKSPQTDDLILDNIEAFIQRGRTAGALLFEEEDRAVAQTLLDYWDTALYRAGREVDDSTLADLDEMRAPLLDDALCPYIGLDAFHEGTHEQFFGRESLIAQWIEQLKVQRLLIVVGPSGSGKSSLVLGGLVPALKTGALPGSVRWTYVPPLVPGSDPLANLARVMRPAGTAPAEWTRPTVDRFRSDPGHLLQLVKASGEGPFVFVIDQLEELFTLSTDELVRHAFADNLLSLVKAADAGHIVVATIRSDFEQYLGCLDDLPANVEMAKVRVTPLSAIELRDVIEKPAEQVGLKFEAGIVDDLIQDMHNQPTGLPLLQFTLQKLWEQRRRNRVTREAYERLGGVHQALERSADLLYESLIPQNQEVLKHILLRMIRPDRGLEVTSNRVTRQSLYLNNFAQERVDEVLDKLIDARLVRKTRGETPDDDQVEVAHEVLVRNWSRLLDWLDEERDAIRSRLRLTTLAEQWDAQGRPTESLLRGRILDEALEHRGYSPLGDIFLTESQAAQDRERRYHQRAKMALSTAGVMVVLSLLVFVGLQLRQAEEQSNVRLSRQLAAQSGALLKEGQRDLALLLGIEAYRAHAELEAQRSLLDALAYTPTTAIVRKQTMAARGLAFSPDGQLMATVDSEGRILLWSTSTFETTGSAFKAVTPSRTTIVATGLAFSKDGSSLAITTDDGQIVALCVATKAPRDASDGACPPSGPSRGPVPQTASSLVTRSGDTITVWDPDLLAARTIEDEPADLTDDTGVFALSPNGKVLAGGSSDGRLSLWDATTGQPYETVTSIEAPDGQQRPPSVALQLPVQSTGVTSLAFSQDGSRLAWGLADGTVQVAQFARGRVQHTFKEAREPVTSLAFGPDDRLAWGSSTGALYVRDASPATLLPLAQIRSQPLDAQRTSVAAVAVRPNGHDLAFVTPDGGVDMLNLESQSTTHPFDVGAPTTSLAFDTRGRRLAIADGDRTVRLWDVATGASSLLVDGAQRALASSLAFNSAGNLLAIGMEDGQIVLWDVAAGAPSDLGSIGHSRRILQLDFSPDGRTLASVGEDSVQILNLDGHERPLQFRVSSAAATTSIRSIDFSPDGRLLATGATDGTITLWDTWTGDQRFNLLPVRSAKAPGSESGSTSDRIAVTSLAFGPGGALLAAGAVDGGLTLWDTRTGLPLASPLKLGAEPLTGLSFSADGKQLASGSADFPLVLWSLDVDSWIDLACAAARRDLTETEWRRYLGEKEYRQTCPDASGQQTRAMAVSETEGSL